MRPKKKENAKAGCFLNIQGYRDGGRMAVCKIGTGKTANARCLLFFLKITQTGLERLPILRILCSITDTVMPEVAMGMAVDLVDWESCPV